jgi:hypothetical protein
VRACLQQLLDLGQRGNGPDGPLQHLSAGWLSLTLYGGNVRGLQGVGEQVDRNTQGGMSGSIAPPQ